VDYDFPSMERPPRTEVVGLKTRAKTSVKKVPRLKFAIPRVLTHHTPGRPLSPVYGVDN